jgi:alkyl hydroperoxide reductase subunit F
MLDASLKEQLKTLFRALEADYVFDIKVRAGHESRTDLLELLEDTASCSDKLSCRIAEGESLEFHLLKDGEDTGVCFKAVPGGHEFSSLILAILNADGKGKNLPDTVTLNRLKRLQGNIQLTTYMSLSCTNCPDVVQALNLMALLNPQIKHTAIDGTLFPEESDRLKIT